MDRTSSLIGGASLFSAGNLEEPFIRHMGLRDE